MKVEGAKVHIGTEERFLVKNTDAPKSPPDPKNPRKMQVVVGERELLVARKLPGSSIPTIDVDTEARLDAEQIIVSVNVYASKYKPVVGDVILEDLTQQVLAIKAPCARCEEGKRGTCPRLITVQPWVEKEPGCYRYEVYKVPVKPGINPANTSCLKFE